MNTDPRLDPEPYDADGLPPESAVAWGAVAAGAVAAAAISILLVMLGAGLGLSSVSPWAGEGIAAGAFGVGAIVWVTVTQLIASGMGGYIAGRLRSTWDGVHGDEIHFRDTAHGFLAWAVASLATATLLTSVVGGIVGGGAKAASTLAGGVSSGASMAAGVAAGSASKSDDDGSPLGYWVSSMFRAPAAPTPTASATEAAPSADGAPAPMPMPQRPTPIAPELSARVLADAGQIMVQSLKSGTLSPEDRRYLGQLVAQQSGAPAPEAEKKVDETFARIQAATSEAKQKAQEAADAARKASAKATLWLFISLLIGAFVASLAALFGGRHRVA